MQYLLKKLGGRAVIGIFSKLTPWLFLTSTESERHVPGLLQAHNIDSEKTSGMNHLGNSVVNCITLLDYWRIGGQDNLVLDGADTDESLRSRLLRLSWN